MTALGQQSPAEAGDDPGGGRPRFSVVIPAFNEVRFLGDCLDSIAKQDFGGPVEIIVVDNNSTDGTADLATSRGAKVTHEPTPGVCSARQCGTLAARGEIVVSTDADTVYDEGWLSRIDRAFRADPALVAVAGPCQFVDAPVWGRMYSWALFWLVEVLNRFTGRVRYATATNIAFLRSAWPGYDVSATQGGDELDLLRKLRTRGGVAFDRGNPVFTSSRRLRKGLAYNIFVTCLYYYLIGYALNRIAGRRIIGMAPAFRASARPVGPWRRAQTLVATSVGLAVCAVVGGFAWRLVYSWL